jgi:hypothetical protein
MGLNSRKLLLLTFGLLASVNVFSQDVKVEPTFFEKLKKQEMEEHQTLVSQVKSMDDKRYRKLLNKRVSDSYKQKKGDMSGFVIVDVTEEMNQPESGFLAKIFSSQPAEEEYGINEVKEALGSTGVGNGRKLKFYKKFSSTDKQKHFQWVEGSFTKGDAMSLVAKGKIVDLHVTAPKYPTWSTAVAIDTDTGRVLPPRAQKEYDEEFINEGVYQDLLKEFDRKETVLVRVNFRIPDGYVDSKYTKEDQQAQIQAVDDFLDEWKEFKFTVADRGEFHLYLDTSRDHLKAMKGHDFIGSFSPGGSLFLDTNRND